MTANARNLLRTLLLVILLLQTVCVNAVDYEVDVKTELNVRASASANGTLIDKLPDGTVLRDVVMLDNGWAEITHNGNKGYVKADYLMPLVDAVDELADADGESFPESLLSLKVCFIILIVLAALNWAVDQAMEWGEGFGIRCTLFLLQCGMVLLLYYCYDFDDVVNNRWTDGWLDGYAMAFLNSILLAATCILTYNSFIDVSASIVKRSLGSLDNVGKVNVSFFIWIVPVAIVCFIGGMLFMPLSMLLWLVPIVLLIWKVVQNIRILSPHYFLAILITLFGLLTTWVMALLIYTCFEMLIIGCLVCAACLGAARSAPSTIGNAVTNTSSSSTSESSSSWSSNDSTSYDEPEDKPESSSGEYKSGMFGSEIRDSDGNWHSVRDVNSDGSVETHDGHRWDVDGNGRANKMW